jgi:hypothetical protein
MAKIQNTTTKLYSSLNYFVKRFHKFADDGDGFDEFQSDELKRRVKDAKKALKQYRKDQNEHGRIIRAPIRRLKQLKAVK